MQTYDYDTTETLDPDFDDTEMDADLARVLAAAAWHNAMMAFADTGREYSL